MYKIKITYQTGDSFNSHTEENLLELDFADYNVAKKNLDAIIEHYRMHQSLTPYHKVDVPAILNAHKNKDWFVPGDEEACIVLYTDNNKPFQLCCFWIGCFESLISVEIVLKNSKVYL